jgi:hypothetical protein
LGGRKTVATPLWSLGIAAATAAWAQSPSLIKPLHGTTTLLAPTNEFAVATTLPTLVKPRAQYVVVAEANDNQDLEVLAWHDTTSSLESISRHGIAEHQGVVSVAVTGLDLSRELFGIVTIFVVINNDNAGVRPKEYRDKTSVTSDRRSAEMLILTRKNYSIGKNYAISGGNGVQRSFWN